MSAPTVSAIDRLRSRVRGPQCNLDLVRVWARRALNDRAGVPSSGVERSLEPVRRRATVIVGERDHRRASRAPAEVALVAGRASPRVERSVAQHPRGGQRVRDQQLLGLGAARVVTDDHLEASGRERLLFERVQQPAQPQRAVAGGHHHGNLRRRRRLAH